MLQKFSAPLTGGSELSDGNLTDEEEMEQDEMEMLANVINDDSSSDDDDELNKEDEYPGNQILKAFQIFNIPEV